MEHDHTVKAIHERLSAGPKHNYLRDWIYGGIDGSIATFAVITGVVGARLSAFVLIIMGMTTTLAEGFAMAAGNFLATRSEQHNIDHLEAIERRHIELAPEGEREEVRQIFAAKGFAGPDLDRAVELITSDKDRWIQTMLTEEYGLPLQPRSEWMAALATLSAFIICGLAPLIPFLAGMERAFPISIVITAVVFFIIGSIKSRWSMIAWWRSGLSTLFVGGVAAALAYVVGVLLKRLAE